MTGNEILKALKYCEDCSANLNFEIADLINHYKEENEKWREQFLYLDVECERLELEEENNRIEIERLKEENNILSQNADTAFQDGLNEAQDLYAEQVRAEVRANAIREFAEKLKSHSYIVSNESQSGIILRYSVVTANQIDSLVKEMVGNNNVKFE